MIEPISLECYENFDISKIRVRRIYINKFENNLYFQEIKNTFMEKVNVLEKFDLFSDHWDPKIVGELNGQHVKLVKFQGDFIWHLHEKEDELFFVIKGKFKMQFRGEREIEVNENEFLIVPKGIEHRSSAEEETFVMVFEPASAVNTGNVQNELTRRMLEHL